jgi:hypothetical protein
MFSLKVLFYSPLSLQPGAVAPLARLQLSPLLFIMYMVLTSTVDLIAIVTLCECEYWLRRTDYGCLRTEW